MNLLAAIGALSQMPRLLQRVVPPEQNFDSGSYTGMFRYSVTKNNFFTNYLSPTIIMAITWLLIWILIFKKSTIARWHVLLL
jgi:hypothetical protein